MILLLRRTSKWKFKTSKMFDNYWNLIKEPKKMRYMKRAVVTTAVDEGLEKESE